ncbi:MAG TPA: hypothetical protein VEG30_06100 [Terriglobales bacterium]|nr:hypothetical protein [Terriglobales bacterium]
MSSVKQYPDLSSVSELQGRPDYETWLEDVRAVLLSMNAEMRLWQDNWRYDFRQAYEAGTSAHEAAMDAREFWWRELLTECWT